MTNRAVLAAAAACLTAGAACAVPGVGNVTMAQRTNSRIVDIGYTLSGEAAIVTLSIETNGVAIPDAAVTRLSGDVCKVVGTGAGKSIVWNAGADWPEHVSESTKAKVTAWFINAPPQVMVLDLSKGIAATEADPYPVYYYTSLDALPGGGLSNAVYKSEMLVMNKIPAGVYAMGYESTADASVVVTLTKDFYAGVFQVTQGQWYQVMGLKPSYFTDVSSWLYRPVEQVSYYEIRENPNNSAISPNWPQSNTVGEVSFMGRLGTKTGLAGFDLPTEAQWEYACRAGTTTYYNDNLGIPANATSNAQMDVLGRYRSNGGLAGYLKASCGPSNGTAIVGSYLPNAWGLYDMHGNMAEWCLDWSASSLEGGKDPQGAASSTSRVRRGGSWYNDASGCRSAYRSSVGPHARYSDIGFRLFRNLP